MRVLNRVPVAMSPAARRGNASGAAGTLLTGRVLCLALLLSTAPRATEAASTSPLHAMPLLRAHNEHGRARGRGWFAGTCFFLCVSVFVSGGWGGGFGFFLFSVPSPEGKKGRECSACVDRPSERSHACASSCPQRSISHHLVPSHPHRGKTQPARSCSRSPFSRPKPRRLRPLRIF